PALDQLNAHEPGQESMLEISRIEYTGCQYDNRRVGPVAGSQGSQSLEQQRAVIFDRPYTLTCEQSGKDLFHHLPVGQHIRNAAWHSEIVLEHRELPVVEPHEIGADNRNVRIPGHPYPAHLAAIMAASVDHFARDDAFGEDAALVVHIL